MREHHQRRYRDAPQSLETLARRHGLDRNAAEQFFRLALDCNLDPGDARSVHDAVLTIR